MSLIASIKSWKGWTSLGKLFKTKTFYIGATLAANGLYTHLTGQPSFSDAILQQLLQFLQGQGIQNNIAGQAVQSLVQGDPSGVWQLLTGSGLITLRQGLIKSDMATQEMLTRIMALLANGSKSQDDITSGGSTSSAPVEVITYPSNPS